MNIRKSNTPPEVWLHTFSFLNKTSLMNAEATCAFWRKEIGDSDLWRQLLCTKLGIMPADLKATVIQHSAKILVNNIDRLIKMTLTNKEIYRNISSFFKKNRNHALMVACIDDNVSEFKKISKANPKLNINAWVDFACAYGAHLLVQHLIGTKLSRNIDEVMLKLAAGSGNESLVECLLKANPALILDESINDYARLAAGQMQPCSMSRSPV